MARDQKLNVDITATDKASAEITDVAKKVDRLDGETADVKIDADTSGAREGIDSIGSALEDLGVPIGNISSKLGGLASPAGAVAAIGAGLLLAADHAADLAIEADEVAALTGDTVEDASRLAAVWKQGGGEVSDLKDVLLQMEGSLRSNAGIAAQLGIDLNDGATSGQRFEQVVEALDRIPDATKRSQIAAQLFGEEGVRQYSALKQAVGDVSDAMENVPDDAVISAEDVERARETKREMAELKAELEAFAVAIGSTVVPAVGKLVGGLNDLFDGAERAGRSIRGWFDDDAARNWAIVDAFDEAEAAAKNFDTSLLDGLTTFDDVSAKAQEYGEEVLGLEDAYHFANKIAIEWNKTNEEAEEQVARLTDKQANMSRGLSQLERDQFKAERAAREHEDALRELDEAYTKMRDDITGERAFLQLSEDLYAAGGNADITRLEVLDLKDEVVRYAEEVGEIPPEVTTDILALIDEGKYGEALTMLAELERPRYATVIVTPSGGEVRVGSDGRRRGGGTRAEGARGAIVTQPTEALIGEAGDEAVIPLDQMPGASPLGSTSVVGVSSTPTNVTLNEVTHNHYVTFAAQGSLNDAMRLYRLHMRGQS